MNAIEKLTEARRLLLEMLTSKPRRMTLARSIDLIDSALRHFFTDADDVAVLANCEEEVPY